MRERIKLCFQRVILACVFTCIALFTQSCAIIRGVDLDALTTTQTPNTVSRISFNQKSNTVTADSSGNIYVGGNFTSVNPTSSHGAFTYDTTSKAITPLAPTSTVGFQGGTKYAYDANFTATARDRLTILARVVLPDGSTVIGGTFLDYEKTGISYLMILNPDGTVNKSYTAAVKANGNLDGPVNAISYDAINKKVYLFGSFKNVGKFSTQYAARFDATTWMQDTAYDFKLDAPAYAGLYLNGKVYAGGSFTKCGSKAMRYLCAFDVTGPSPLSDKNFLMIKGGNEGPNKPILTMAASTNGSTIYAGGLLNSFTYNGSIMKNATTGVNLQNVVALNANTGAPDLFNTMGDPINGLIQKSVTWLTVDAADNIYLTSFAGGSTQFAKYNSTLTYDTNLQSKGKALTASGTITSIGADSKNIYLSGKYDTLVDNNSGKTSKGAPLVALSAATGASDATFMTGVFSTGITELVQVSGTKIAVYGIFDQVGGIQAQYLVKFDKTGTFDQGFTPLGTPGFDGPVTKVKVNNNLLYVAGSFSSYRGNAATNFAVLNLDGTPETNYFAAAAAAAAGGMTGGFDNVVADFDFDPTGNVYAAGNFSTYNGTTSKFMAKIDFNSALVPGFAPDNVAVILNSTTSVTYNKGSVYVCVTPDGVTFTNYMMFRLNAVNGAVDATMAPLQLDGPIYAFGISGNLLYFGGSFSNIQTGPPTPLPYLGRFDMVGGVADLTFNDPANSLNSNVNAIVVESNSIVVAGAFSAYGAAATAGGIARFDFKSNLDLTGMNDQTQNSFDGGVNAIVYTNGNYIGVGSFANYRGIAAGFFTALNASSGANETLAP